MLTTTRDAAIYDAQLDEGREPSTPCPVCTGDNEAPPCGEDCDRIIRRADAKARMVTLHYEVERVLIAACGYAREGLPADRRVVDCIKRAQDHMDEIACLRIEAA